MIQPPEEAKTPMNGLAGLRWLVAYLEECNIPATEAEYRAVDDTYRIHLAHPLFVSLVRVNDVGLNVFDTEPASNGVWLVVDLPRCADLSDWQE